jgi:hypothetical protein
MINKTCAVVIPIYKSSLSDDEFFSVKTSIINLHGHNIYWLAPNNLDINYYVNNFNIINIERFDNMYFKNIKGYNQLLLSREFYLRFNIYDFLLICQTDAIVLKPELNYWLTQPYDYIGAPWPKGYSFPINTFKISQLNNILCTSFVGNGGLSLRRIKSILDLLNEFSDVAKNWHDNGHAEDLYYAFMSTLSCNFKTPNLMISACFSHDIDPVYLYKLIGCKTPFGGHAWAKYDREHWKKMPEWPSY